MSRTETVAACRAGIGRLEICGSNLGQIFAAKARRHKEIQEDVIRKFSRGRRFWEFESAKSA